MCSFIFGSYMQIVWVCGIWFRSFEYDNGYPYAKQQPLRVFFPFKTSSRELLGAVIDILSMNLAMGLVGYLNDLEVPFWSYRAGHFYKKRKTIIMWFAWGLSSILINHVSFLNMSYLCIFLVTIWWRTVSSHIVKESFGFSLYIIYYFFRPFSSFNTLYYLNKVLFKPLESLFSIILQALFAHTFGLDQ